MSIIEQLTPTQYLPVRLVVEIRPDTTLTVASLTFHTDIRILNEFDVQIGNDHPTPQVTPAQEAAFLAWVLSNLATYETAVGLTRHTEEIEK